MVDYERIEKEIDGFRVFVETKCWDEWLAEIANILSNMHMWSPFHKHYIGYSMAKIHHAMFDQNKPVLLTGMCVIPIMLVAPLEMR